MYLHTQPYMHARTHALTRATGHRIRISRFLIDALTHKTLREKETHI